MNQQMPSIYDLAAARGVGADTAATPDWEGIAMGAPLTWEAFTVGMRLLTPLHRRQSATGQDWKDYAGSYWMILHGDPGEDTATPANRHWLTNGVWRRVVERIGRTQSEMPKPRDVESVCVLERNNVPADPRTPALQTPQGGTETRTSATIRAENMRRMRTFHLATTKATSTLMARGGVRDQIVSSCQREGLTGERLRLTVALRFQEEILRRPRAAMPTFLSDAGRDGVGREEAERWNEKQDVEDRIRRIREELADLDAGDAAREEVA